MRTTVTRAVLAATAGLTLAAAAAPVAAAQEDTTPPPTTIVRAVAECAVDGVADVSVILDDLGPYLVTLSGLDREPQETTFNEDNYVYETVFADVPIGEYVVSVKGHHEASDGVPVKVVACAQTGPTAPQLSVEVACRGGWGIATFVVTNPSTGERRAYTLEIVEEFQEYRIPDLFPGMFLRISENLYDDGLYTAVLSADGMEPISKEFTVKCAPKDQPTVVATARCDDKPDLTAPAIVSVTVGNPNRHDAEYTVTVGDVTKSVRVTGGWQETLDVGPFDGGVYPMTVIGSDGTETPAHVLVDHCADVVPDDDGLQIAVRCVDEGSIVTVRFFPSDERRVFKVAGRPEFDAVVAPDRDGFYDWIRHEGIEDGTYTATLTGPDKQVREDFTVDCVAGQPTTTTAPPTTGTSTPPSTTTAPPPQGRPDPVDDLPNTGAAVTGMVLLGLAALGLGGGLVLLARRKRA
ncbi:LPXTG cell wall anchor domain-containing protein [Actinokineospora sp. NPDC004072]